MGKKRIIVVDAGKSPEKTKEEKGRKIVKTGKAAGRLADMGAIALAEAEKIKDKKKKLAEETKTKETVKKKVSVKAKTKGKKYLAARKKIDRKKAYPLTKAIKLAQETSITKFNGSIDVHLVVKEKGLKGEIKFPHSTGKQTKIVIADDKVLKKIEKGKIDFTLLLATPAMMPKLAKYAKILGPRGLMPNPKAGTITDKPEETIKKMAGKVQFRTEAKVPLIHLTIGKVNSKTKDLEANLEALVKVVGLRNIQKAVLASTMGPGIKIDLVSLTKD